MRKIKFRGFHKNINEMEYYDTVSFLNFEEDVLCYQKLPENEPHGFSDMSAIELMQFTGLKDKNSTEIYEGDIIKTGWQGKVKGVVVFDSPTYCVDTGDGYMYFNHPDSYEVIGNIYENSELLEEME